MFQVKDEIDGDKNCKEGFMVKGIQPKGENDSPTAKMTTITSMLNEWPQKISI